MNTLTLTIEATPDNLRRLAAAFGDGIDLTISADDVPCTRAGSAGETINAPRILPEAKVPETVAKEPKTAEKEPENESKPQETAAKAPEPARTVTMTDLRTKAKKLAAGEHRDGLKALLDKFGVKRVTELPEADYPAFMAGLEAIA